MTTINASTMHVSSTSASSGRNGKRGTQAMASSSLSLSTSLSVSTTGTPKTTNDAKAMTRATTETTKPTKPTKPSSACTTATTHQSRADMDDMLSKSSPDSPELRAFLRDILFGSLVAGDSGSRKASTSAADLAYVTTKLGVAYVMLDCGIWKELEGRLLPQAALGEEDGKLAAVSSSSSKEGCFLFLRALIDAFRGSQQSPKPSCKAIEPYVVRRDLLMAALEGCSGSNNNTAAARQAAEESCRAIVSASHPYAFRTILGPTLLLAIQGNHSGSSTNPDWRVKVMALELLTSCCSDCSDYSDCRYQDKSFAHPEGTGGKDRKDRNDHTTNSGSSNQESPSHLRKQQVYRMIPTLLPVITDQLWDTKVEVSKAARSTLTAIICNTNSNPDITPALPSLITAICTPNTNDATNKAVTELMSTTFVVPVDASVLSMLCPLLARALKEKLAVHKRAACIVITNMCKLVHQPSDIAPFGTLLVPELHRVVQNVQFEEIRDVALSALANLTRALGQYYYNSTISNNAHNTNNTNIAHNTNNINNTNNTNANSSSTTASTALSTTSITTTCTTSSVQQHGQGQNSDDPNSTNSDSSDAPQLQQQPYGQSTLGGNLLRESDLAEQERERIAMERQKEAALQEQIRAREDEERRRFKEAMDAQRELDKIAAQQLRQQKEQQENAREKQRLSTKSAAGKCQSCGLKKCKKTCMFFGK